MSGPRVGRKESVSGREAEKPTEIPVRGWIQVVRRAWREGKADHVSLLAGGVAYAAFLALFPAVIGAVMLYGLVADPADVTGQVERLARGLPRDAQGMLETRLRAIAEGSQTNLGVGLVVALAAALWAAAGGVNGLIEAINIAYDETDTRGFLKKRAVALLLTLGGVVYFVLAITLVAVAPAAFDAFGLNAAGRVVAEVLRWIVLVAGVMIALAMLYRTAPDRDAPKLRWVSLGAVVATVVWVLASAGFSLYVDNFGRYAKTYGALAGVVVLMLWLYLTAFIVLLGAEINAESEQQTIRDTTRGEPRPVGQPDAVKATPGQRSGPRPEPPANPRRPHQRGASHTINPYASQGKDDVGVNAIGRVVRRKFCAAHPHRPASPPR